MWDVNMLKKIYSGLDKNCIKWSGYFDVYERHLGKFVGKAPKILEIGIFDGGSLEMWYNYFGEGTKTVGIDIDSRCLEYKYNHDYAIELGDQSDKNFWKSIYDKYGDFDIILDDGGHQMQQQIVTLECGFPHLTEGGIIIIEDTHTSYYDSHGGNGENSFMNYAKKLLDIPQHQFYNKDGHLKNLVEHYKDIYSINIYNSMVILEKRKYEAMKDLNSKQTFFEYNV